MKREKLIEKLKEAIRFNGDPEVAHGMADKALIEFIDDVEVKELYEEIEKWYA